MTEQVSEEIVQCALGFGPCPEPTSGDEGCPNYAFCQTYRKKPARFLQPTVKAQLADVARTCVNAGRIREFIRRKM